MMNEGLKVLDEVKVKSIVESKVRKQVQSLVVENVGFFLDMTENIERKGVKFVNEIEKHGAEVSLNPGSDSSETLYSTNNLEISIGKECSPDDKQVIFDKVSEYDRHLSAYYKAAEESEKRVIQITDRVIGEYLEEIGEPIDDEKEVVVNVDIWSGVVLTVPVRSFTDAELKAIQQQREAIADSNFETAAEHAMNGTFIDED